MTGKSFVTGIVCVTAFFLCSVRATGGQRDEDAGEREEMKRQLQAQKRQIKALQEQVEKLEQRMAATEKSEQRREARKGPRSGADLQRRVENVEKKLQGWDKPDTLQAYWDKGLRLKTRDDRFKLKLGGRLMNDWTFWTSRDDDVEDFLGEDLEDGTEFRRARLYVAGTLYDRLNFKAQYDFAGGDADLKDAYLELTELPVVGNVKAGHFKEPFSLEEQTSSKYITFLERGQPNALSPGRNVGVMLHDTALGDRVTWAGGVFRETDGFGDSDGVSGTGDYVGTARVTGLPWYENDGERLLHVGLGYSHRNVGATAEMVPGDALRVRSRPEVHDTARFVDTGDFGAEKLSLMGVESAVVCGPFSLQGEYMTADVDSGSGGDPRFSGYYLQASYFLTGEHRPYKTSSGAFGRVSPQNNFLDEGGLGAWEVGARYSTLDLSDEAISGGELDNMTVGINWYLNPNARIMFNYVHSDLDDVGSVGAFLTRLQVDF